MIKGGAILALILLAALLVSGCVSEVPGGDQESVQNSGQAAEAVSNISEDVNEISSTLEDIESMFE